MNLNKVFIVGNLTRDPEIRQTGSGQSVCTFGLATNRMYTDQAGQKQTQVEFHNIVTWGKQADIVHQYLQKGSLALIEGRIQTRSWQDPQGQKHWRTEIISERIQFGPRSAGSGGRPNDGRAYTAGFSTPAAPSAQSSLGAPSKQNEAGHPADAIPIIELPDEGVEIDVKDIPF